MRFPLPAGPGRVSPLVRAARGACRWLRLLPAALGALAVAAAQAEPVPLATRPAPLAEHLAPGARVGNMRFLGMLALPSLTVDGARLSQLSDLAWDRRAGVLYAISDKGFLFHLRPVLRGDVLVDVELVRAVRLREREGGEPLHDRRGDAEGLELLAGPDGTELLISFERFPRVMRYRPDGRALGELPLPTALRAGDAYVHANHMLEAVCRDPELGVLTMPEEPLAGEPEGRTRVYGLDGRSWRYPVAPEDRVVSLACRGDGELLVLEGNFGSRFWRSHATLKRVRLGGKPPGALLAPETLFRLESSRGYQIDNFEGIAHHRGRRFFLVSDDNDFFLQRTLLLYVELLD